MHSTTGSETPSLLLDQRKNSIMNRILPLSALFIALATAACTTIGIEMNDESGCCCKTCGCNGNEGTGGTGGTGGGGEQNPTTTSSSSSSASSGSGGQPNGNQCVCVKGFAPTPAGDECIRETFTTPTESPKMYAVCEAPTNLAYNKYGAVVEAGGSAPGGSTAHSPYWGDAAFSGSLGGRLNSVGVWACDVDNNAHEQPYNEWIGFASCLKLSASGDYILGIAGDNAVRLDVDGITVYSADPLTPAETDSFDHWHLLPIHLASGTHIIELRGKNLDSAASFGAEISGPFPAGSLSTDAAVLDEANYSSHIVFSTGDLAPGTTFNLGQNSGWKCPDGTALDLCTPEPTCRTLEVQPCIESEAPHNP
jgi:hypothetical protein